MQRGSVMVAGVCFFFFGAKFDLDSNCDVNVWGFRCICVLIFWRRFLFPQRSLRWPVFGRWQLAKASFAPSVLPAIAQMRTRPEEPVYAEAPYQTVKRGRLCSAAPRESSGGVDAAIIRVSPSES